MFWASINTVLAILVALLVTVKLSRFAELLNPGERIGLGLQGAAAVMGLAVRWDLEGRGTPYDGWCTTLWLIGLLVYLSARMSRHIRHARRNAQSAEAMRESIAAHRAGG